MASDLVERFVATDSTKIGGHLFTAFLHVWFHNSAGLGSEAASLAVAKLNLSAGEVTTANAMKTVYDGMSIAGKVEYTGRIQSGLSMLEAGVIDTDKFEEMLEID